VFHPGLSPRAARENLLDCAGRSKECPAVERRRAARLNARISHRASRLIPPAHLGRLPLRRAGAHAARIATGKHFTLRERHERAGRPCVRDQMRPHLGKAAYGTGTSRAGGARPAFGVAGLLSVARLSALDRAPQRRALRRTPCSQAQGPRVEQRTRPRPSDSAWVSSARQCRLDPTSTDHQVQVAESLTAVRGAYGQGESDLISEPEGKALTQDLLEVCI
jgi:hypothetical protein